MEDFIGRYYLDDLSACDETIQLFNDFEHLHGPGKTSGMYGEQVDIDAKDSTDIKESFDFFNSQPATKKLLDFLWKSVEDYAEKYDCLWHSYWQIRPILKLQYYKPPSGGFKKFHCERLSASSSVCLVWMFYLNTVDNGGGTEFRYQNHIEKAEKGKLVLWPSDFTHTHRGIPSPSEEKYIFTGWYEFV